MGIEITKKGKQTIKADVHCCLCDCEFTCAREDVYWDRITCEYRVKCPNCGEDIFAAFANFWED